MRAASTVIASTRTINIAQRHAGSARADGAQAGIPARPGVMQTSRLSTIGETSILGAMSRSGAKKDRVARSSEAAAAAVIPASPPSRWAGRRRLQTITDQIAERIYADIVAGEYAPGERIREEELAELFGVSRGPIRDALRVLEKDAVVRLLPNRGASVTPLSIKEVNEIFEIRKLLAGAMVRRLGGRDKAFIARLQERVAQLEALVPRADGQAAYAAGTVALTLDLADASGNERLAQIMESLARQSSRYTRLVLATPERRRESARSWRAMVTALAANRIDDAAVAVEKLIDDARREAVRVLENAASADEPATARDRRRRETSGP
jgi:DNA-binding GntR family transcriptional regulator